MMKKLLSIISILLVVLFLVGNASTGSNPTRKRNLEIGGGYDDNGHSLDENGNMDSGGSIRAGIEDTILGSYTSFGDSNILGGTLSIENAANEDTTYNWYRIDADDDKLRILNDVSVTHFLYGNGDLGLIGSIDNTGSSGTRTIYTTNTPTITFGTTGGVVNFSGSAFIPDSDILTFGTGLKFEAQAGLLQIQSSLDADIVTIADSGDITTVAEFIGKGTLHEFGETDVARGTLQAHSTSGFGGRILLDGASAGNNGGIVEIDGSTGNADWVIDNVSGELRIQADSASQRSLDIFNSGASDILVDITGELQVSSNITLDADLILSTTASLIRTDTSDASDTKSIFLASSSVASMSRGAWITVYGNEHSSEMASIIFNTGNAGGATIKFIGSNESNVAELNMDIADHTGLVTIHNSIDITDDSLIGGATVGTIATAGGADTTPSVAGVGILKLLSSLTYTDFDDGTDGQVLILIGPGAPACTVDIENSGGTGPITGNSGGDISLAYGSVILIQDGTKWRALE